MMTRRPKLTACLFVLCSLLAWNRAAAQEGSAKACCDSVDRCSRMTDQDILFFAEKGELLNPFFGTCYFHTKESCPSCACDFYVKVSHYGGQKGFDGGTGCLNSEQEVVAALRQLCADGVCCCPQKAPSGVCPAGEPVWARDPLTGSCCQYQSSCLTPTDWKVFLSEVDCKGGISHVDPNE